MSIQASSRTGLYAGLLLAALHTTALASYGQMNLTFPWWFYLGAAAVFALPGALVVLALQAKLGGRDLPRGLGVLAAMAMAGLLVNAGITHPPLASWRADLKAVHVFALPVLGTLWVLSLRLPWRQERTAAWLISLGCAAAVSVTLRQGGGRADPAEYSSVLVGGVAVSMGAWLWGHRLALGKRPQGYALRQSWGAASNAVAVAGRAILLAERALDVASDSAVRLWRWRPTVRLMAVSLVVLAGCIARWPLDMLYRMPGMRESGVGAQLRRLVWAVGEDAMRSMAAGWVLAAAWLIWRGGRGARPDTGAWPLRPARLGAAIVLAAPAYYALLFSGWGRFDRGAGPLDHLLMNALAVVAACLAFDACRGERSRAVRAACALLGAPLAVYAALSVLRVG